MRIGRSAVIVLGCCVSASGARAQERLSLDRIGSLDRGPTIGSLGARVSFFFYQHGKVATGLELGYARLAGVETGFNVSPGGASSVIEPEGVSRKMWSASLTARRSWRSDGPFGVYAGGGSGVYYLQNRSELWESPQASSDFAGFREVRSSSFEFGLNLGGGFELRPFKLPTTLDLDVRYHVLPFAGASGLRSVFTVSAGFSIY